MLTPETSKTSSDRPLLRISFYLHCMIIKYHPDWSQHSTKKKKQLVLTSSWASFGKAERQSGKQLQLCIHKHRARSSPDEFTHPLCAPPSTGEPGKLAPTGVQDILQCLKCRAFVFCLPYWSLPKAKPAITGKPGNNESCTQNARNTADIVLLICDKQLVIGQSSARTNPINK